MKKYDPPETKKIRPTVNRPIEDRNQETRKRMREALGAAHKPEDEHKPALVEWKEFKK